MKAALCFLALMLTYSIDNAQSPCADTLLKPNTKIRDTMTTIPPVVCPSKCYGSAGASVEISDSCGVVLVTGNPQVVHLVLSIGCDSVLLDTCVMLGQPPAFVALAYDWAGSGTYYLTAYGPPGYIVTFSSGPTQSGLPPPPPLAYDADTCGGALIGVAPVQVAPHECLWQNPFGEFGEIPLPLGLWFCRECRRKIVVGE